MREVLNREHYLKAGRPAGHVLWQSLYQTDSEDGTLRLCAVLCWAGAALRLKERDQLIGWNPLTRARRRLPGQGEEIHGFRPRSLALDGKDVGHARGAVVSLGAHQDGGRTPRRPRKPPRPKGRR